MNYLAIIFGAIINMVAGFVWYSPILFANPWMKEIGKTDKDMKKSNMGQLYGFTAVMAMIMSFVLMYFINALHITTLGSGVLLGILIWIGFVVATCSSDYLFSGRSLRLFAINAGYYLVVLILISALFSQWH